MLCAVSLVQCCLFLYSRILRKHSTDDFFLFFCRHRYFFFFFFFFKLTFVNLHTRMELFWEQQLTFRSNLDFWELTNMIQLWNFLFHFTWCKTASSNSQWQWMTVKVGLTFSPKNLTVPVHRPIAGAAPSVAKPTTCAHIVSAEMLRWCIIPNRSFTHCRKTWNDVCIHTCGTVTAPTHQQLGTLQ